MQKPPLVLVLVAAAGTNAQRQSCAAHGFRLGAAALVTVGNGAADSVPSGWPLTPVPLSSPPLSVAGDAPPRGIFDPSLLLVSGHAFLAYSSVSATENISTHIAAADGRGGWLLQGRVNAAAVNTSLPCAGGPCMGSFIHETPSLVSKSEGLRIFTHSYAITNDGTLHYDWGHIALWTTNGFGSDVWQGGPLLGWASASPLSTNGVAAVLSDVPALSDCVLFCEPGAATDPHDASRTLLALGCAAAGAGGGAATIRIVLLASSDAALRSWAYQGMLVDGATDAARLGYAIPQLNAADLFAVPPAGLFLTVSPAAEIFPALSGYVGCLVMQLLPDNVGVVRNASGAPTVLREVAPAAPAFAGACTAAAGAQYLLPVLDTLGAFFTIRASAQAPV